MANPSLLPAALDAELDEVLSLLPLVEVVPDLGGRVFSRLTDCLVEAVLHDVRVRHEEGELDRSAYLIEVCGLVVAMEEQGLTRRGGSGPLEP